MMLEETSVEMLQEFKERLQKTLTWMEKRYLTKSKQVFMKMEYWHILNVIILKLNKF